MYARYHLASSELLDKEKASFSTVQAPLSLLHAPQGLLELQRAQRTARQEPGWEKDWEKVQRVASLTLHYCRGTLRHGH